MSRGGGRGLGGTFLTAIDPAATAQLADIGVKSGSLADLGPDAVAITETTDALTPSTQAADVKAAAALKALHVAKIAKELALRPNQVAATAVQISSGSCSTQPGRGKYCGNSR